ncbi:MAG: hypothetical protein KBT14_01860 [Proteobacteria bacterium]|nr:hypothetical protein [Candidatus Enterousia onthequi]
MKLRNLAFFGVMASILGINGAYADTTDPAVIIASQAYVDAQNALDEKVVNKEAANYTTLNDTVKGSTTKYPSMNTLTTAINSVDLSGAVANLDLAAQTGNGVIKTVTQTNGQVAATRELIGTNDIGNSAVTMPKTDFVIQQGTSKQGWNTASDSSTDGDEKALAEALKGADKYVPTVGAVEVRVKDAIAEAKAAIPSIGNATVNADSGKLVTGVTTTAGKVTTVSSSKVTDSYIDDNTINGGKLTAGTVTKAKLDTTVQASLDLADSALQASDIKTGTDGLASTTSTTTAPSEKAVADELAKKADIDDVYSTDEADKKFEVVANKVTATEFDSNATSDTKYPTVAAVADKLVTKTNASDILEDSETWDASTNNAKRNIEYPSVAAVTKYVENATSGKLNKNKAITAQNNSIVNYDANGLVTGGTLLEDATGGLTGVNAENAGNMGCSASNPCVLTYLGGSGEAAKYRWTAMDTDQLTAQ